MIILRVIKNPGVAIFRQNRHQNRAKREHYIISEIQQEVIAIIICMHPT